MNILNMSLLFPQHIMCIIEKVILILVNSIVTNLFFSMFLFFFHNQKVKIKYKPYVSICKIII